MIDIESLKVTDFIDLKLLQQFQDSFSKSMDIATVVVDRDGKPVTNPSSFTDICKTIIPTCSNGNIKCQEAHRKGGEMAAKIGKPYIYKCHAGLIDFAAPILVDGIHIGTVLGGQVLTKSPETESYSELISKLNLDEEQFENSLKDIKILDKEKLLSAAEALFIMANALSKIGYESLRLKLNSEKLKDEVVNKNILLEKSQNKNISLARTFSVMSHELKTPINIIFSALQLLEAQYESNSYISDSKLFCKYSKIMKQNCYRLVRLINNLIDMNKIENGFYKLKLVNSDIIKTIEDITLSVVQFANFKNIDIVFDTDVEEKMTAYDPEKIERIMLNILSNAIKYTESNGLIQVNIYDKVDFLLISIKDSGIGIPEHMHKKIFENYIQVEDSIEKKPEGSGIGLSLVKSLVEMHKGKISVKSEVGIGSEFIIELPITYVENSENCENESIHTRDYVEKIQIEFSDIYQ